MSKIAEVNNKINLFSNSNSRDDYFYIKQHTTSSKVDPLLLSAVEQVTVVREGEDDPLPVDSLQLDHLLLVRLNLHQLDLVCVLRALQLLQELELLLGTEEDLPALLVHKDWLVLTEYHLFLLLLLLGQEELLGVLLREDNVLLDLARLVRDQEALPANLDEAEVLLVPDGQVCRGAGLDDLHALSPLPPQARDAGPAGDVQYLELGLLGWDRLCRW